MKDDPFFVGWAETPSPTRRFMLGAALGLTFAGVGASALLAAKQDNPGKGQWRQGDVRDWTGLLVREPYPMLRFSGADGAVRTAFLATSGKLAVRLPPSLDGAVRARASAITRGRNTMLTAIDAADWISPATTNVTRLGDVQPEMRGSATLIGEILDAKCWFGAMKPGFGKTHKECAALCARGGLPLAFCAGGSALCTDADQTLLFLDENGRAHGPQLLPYLADPVSVTGQIVRVGDITEYRVAARDIARI